MSQGLENYQSEAVVSSVSISVLVPAYNDGLYLDDCLKSLALQTERDLEVIVADDGSSDETPEIATSWANRDSRFFVRRIDQNIGMSSNWNRALGEARGEFVLKLDADDAMQPNGLESLRAAFLRDGDIRFAACRTIDCTSDLHPIGPFLGDQAFRLYGLDPETAAVRSGFDWLRICFDDIQPWTSNATMFRTAELRALGGWDARWIAADAQLILRALSTERPVAHVPEPAILYRRRATSSSATYGGTVGAALEVSMIYLQTLSEVANSMRPWGRRLRQNWWRHWSRFRALDRDATAWSSLPSSRVRVLSELAATTRGIPPPTIVRLEGGLRNWLWRLRGGRKRSE